MANETVEIKGGRNEWTRGNQEFKDKIYASTDGSTDIPVRGDAFDGGAVDITDHICLGPEKSWERLPGLCHVRCVFAKFIAYS